MEQYEILPRSCNKVIQTAIKYFELEYLFIRRIGSQGGKVKISEELKGKKLYVRYSKIGFEFFIDGVTRFTFEFSTCLTIPTAGKEWAFAYERFERKGTIDVIWCASAGYPYPGEIYTGPDDPRLPEARSTMLRCVNETHLVEITFKGKIPIIKTGTKRYKMLDYYTIDTERLPEKLQKPRQ